MISRFFKKPVSTGNGGILGFITQHEQIPFPARPEVFIQSCQFNANNYRPELFKAVMGSHAAKLRCSSSKRQAEFIAGRYLANSLLNERGVRDGTVGAGCNGEPIWPGGFNGSISHCADQAICALARKTDIRYLGLDLEPAVSPSVAREIEKLVVSQAEMKLAADNAIAPERLVAMAFSAKESLFKAVSREVVRGFGFDSAQVVHLDEDGSSLTLELNTDICSSLPRGRRFVCSVRQHRGCLFTLIAE